MTLREMMSRDSAVSSGIKSQFINEQRRAIAALLRSPLLQSIGEGHEFFPLVRRHASALRDWFSRHCGWSLHVEVDMARLRKTPADHYDTSRPLLDRNEQPFTRRRYVLLCLALAELAKSERQIVLCQLAEGIVSRFSLEPRLATLGLTFDVSIRDHRRDLIEVIRV